MAFDSLVSFVTADGTPLKGEAQTTIQSDKLAAKAPALTTGNIFEIDDFSFDIEQVLSIGSQSSGAGAGKVTFNPFSITRKTDRISPTLYQMCCAGQHFKTVTLALRRSTGSKDTSGETFLRYDFGLVAVKSISWSGSDGDEACKEEVQFEYGALKVTYWQQGVDGKLVTTDYSGSWNRVNNVSTWDPASGLSMR